MEKNSKILKNIQTHFNIIRDSGRILLIYLACSIDDMPTKKGKIAMTENMDLI